MGNTRLFSFFMVLIIPLTKPVRPMLTGFSFFATFEQKNLISMELLDAHTLTRELIKSGETHPDYKVVTELAEKLAILITGKGMSKLIKQVASRESAEALIQRIQLTNAITPAVAASTKKPFYKVARNQRIKISIELNDKTREALTAEMINGFYGSKNKKNKGLDYWLKTRFMELTFTDPNAWVVAEWDTPESAADKVTARPFEVSSAQAKNFKIVNDETHWLFVEQAVKYLSTDSGKTEKKDGKRYTLYEKDFTVVYEMVCPKYLESIKYELRPGQEYFVDENEVTWLTEYYEPKLGFVAASRVGYARDVSTQGRTFVNPFHDGMCFFDKSIKTVSEFDLTMTLHTFPQKIQYVNSCKGPSQTKKCNSGYLSDGKTCPSCKGTGFSIHTSAQDSILLKMPNVKEEMFDLDKILVYKTPPIELIKFQNDYIQQLKQEVHQAVFNSTVFIKKTSATTAGTGGKAAETATENENDMQSVYDALEPFTEKYSEVFKDFATVMAIICGTPPEDVNIQHTFPADYKLKTADILLRELKAANDSGAPSFLKDSINSDLAEINYQGDILGLTRFRTKRKYYPFNGKSEDEIAMLMSSPYVPERNKILYANFENIFFELEMENPAFFLKTIPAKQAEAIEKKIQEYKDALAEANPTATIDTFRNAVNGGNKKEGEGDPNPGNNDKGAQNSDTENPVD